MKKITSFVLLLSFLISFSVQAQKFLKPFESVSHKKATYITKEDGSEMQGTVKKLNRKKGLIKKVKIKNEDGDKMEMPIEDINYVYFPQSGWDKFMKFDDFITDATQWDAGLYDLDRIKEGYAYFEKSEVKVKKKKRVLLMQLLNPGTCSRIKVYHNPFAGETAGIGVAGIQVAGGKDKSYYIRIDDGVAFKLTKKSYKKQFKEIFGDCKEVKKIYGKAKWSQFEKTVFAYNDACKK